MAEAEIDELLNKKYADLEADFSALLGAAVLAPAQAESVKVAFDLASQKDIAKVLEARGGADPNAVAAIRARTYTKLDNFLKQYDAPAQSAAPVLSDDKLSDMLQDIDADHAASRKRADSRIQAEYQRRASRAASNAPAPATAVQIIPNKSAAPAGGFKAGGLNMSSESVERQRSTGTMISPRKRMASDVDQAKRLSLFEAQLMEETERARAVMAEQQAKEREQKQREADAAAAPPISPRPGPAIRQELPQQTTQGRSTSPSSSRRATAGFHAAPAAEARRAANQPAAVTQPPMNPARLSMGGYRPPSISGSPAAVRGNSPQRRSAEFNLPEMKKAPAPKEFDEPLLIDSYHQLPDEMPKSKDRNCSSCTLV